MEREKRKSKILNCLKNKDNNNCQKKKLPLRRIKEKKIPRENIYDEIDSINDSFRVMSQNGIILVDNKF